MKKLLCYVFFLPLGVAVSGLAWSSDSQAGLESSAPYIAIGLNSTNYSLNKNNIVAGFTGLTQAAVVETNSYNLVASFGYRFDQHMGVQGDIVSGGSVQATEAGVSTKLFDVSQITLSALLHTKVSENLGLYGKLGGTFLQIRNINQTSTKDDHGFGPSIGAGVDYNIFGSKDRTLRFELSHFVFREVMINSADSLTISTVFILQ